MDVRISYLSLRTFDNFKCVALPVLKNYLLFAAGIGLVSPQSATFLHCQSTEPPDTKLKAKVSSQFLYHEVKEPRDAYKTVFTKETWLMFCAYSLKTSVV
ncbi:hypothetical protein RF11_10835 [Thelohanellus kitauei]|uniref:Uncharacterized protein n=1 Tax=Thelohanellus kitauei TaxID=669202 RepID=A0A0C2N3V6_THEKT|nr:hypothetical protein RF11_10835 [Thelohanellus kitauei]